MIVWASAAATATTPTLWKRIAGIAAAAALLPFILLDIVTYTSLERDASGLLFAGSVRRRLLLAAISSSHRPLGTPGDGSPGPAPSTWRGA